MTRGRRLQDHWGRRARREGWPARSVYKLAEIDRRLGLLRPGARVLDLGAAPGSWAMYAAERIGPPGRLVAVDVRPLEVALPANVQVEQADVFELEAETLGCFDVVLSDMAPSTSGHGIVDVGRSEALFERALELARTVLVPGGAFVGKVFQGPGLVALRAKLQSSFEQVRVLRPEATRRESRELFLAGLRRRSMPEPPSGASTPTR
ncbi:MAG: RlmE family RNA methyltransferase [Myxococcota bacterium]|nr:RlmE family RNA methyltransferase [Myxococcota bacterium]MDW8360789.1 RlmE family RNA methyltransferase [Myxococcales bacterium]